MFLITIVNILPIINPNVWESSIILGVSITFYLLKMVNQDLLLNFVGPQYINVFLLPRFFKVSPIGGICSYIPSNNFPVMLGNVYHVLPFRERHFCSSRHFSSGVHSIPCLYHKVLLVYHCFKDSHSCVFRKICSSQDKI